MAIIVMRSEGSVVTCIGGGSLPFTTAPGEFGLDLRVATVTRQHPSGREGQYYWPCGCLAYGLGNPGEGVSHWRGMFPCFAHWAALPHTEGDGATQRQ